MPIPDPTDVPDIVRDARACHWRRTLRLTGMLLLAWFLVGYVVTWFARDLDFPLDRKSTRLNSSHLPTSRMPSSA